MYYQGQPVAPPASAPAHKVHDLVASEEPIFQPWPQGCCLSAAELAAILGGQYMHVAAPVQQQPPAALPAGAFLGLCNEVTGPAITDQRTCAGWGAGLGQYCLGGGADHHQLGKNTDAAPAREASILSGPHQNRGLYCFYRWSWDFILRLHILELGLQKRFGGLNGVALAVSLSVFDFNSDAFQKLKRKFPS
jgi:hypothetical protein